MNQHKPPAPSPRPTQPPPKPSDAAQVAQAVESGERLEKLGAAAERNGRIDNPDPEPGYETSWALPSWDDVRFLLEALRLQRERGPKLIDIDVIARMLEAVRDCDYTETERRKVLGDALNELANVRAALSDSVPSKEGDDNV